MNTNQARSPESATAIESSTDRPEVAAAEIAEETAIPLDAAGHDYGELSKDVTAQGAFWEQHLDLQPLQQTPRGEIIYRRPTGPESNRVVFDAKHRNEFFILDPDNPTMEFNNRPMKATAEIVRAQAEGRDWRALLNEKRNEIFSEYKIHLQPKKEFIPVVMDRLLAQLDTRPLLRELIPALKARLGESEKTAARPDGQTEIEQLPEIVLYLRMADPQSATGQQESRRNMELALAAVAEITADLTDLANGQKPRDNHRINDLLHVAQAGGDIKSALKEIGVAEEFFEREPDGALSFLKGSRPPTTENLQAALTAFHDQERAFAQDNEAKQLSSAQQTMEQVYRQQNDIAPIDVPGTKATTASSSKSPQSAPEKKGLFARLFRNAK